VVKPHTLSHSFATHFLQANYDLHVNQKLLGHSSMKMTMNFTRNVLPEQ